jgi:group I intron endonuclease
MKSGIYKIVNPVGKVYIGQSVSVITRLKQYQKLKNCQEQRLLYNSFLKYGVMNHNFSIIEFCEISLLNEKESHYMKLYDCLNREFGLNIRNAGSIGRHSHETKMLMSKKHKGKTLSDTTKEKMSLSKKANPTNYWLGKKRSKEDIEKFRNSHLGMVNANKPIVQYDLQMNELSRFDGATHAARILGIKRTSIKNNLRGYSKSCNKSIFKYVSDKL